MTDLEKAVLDRYRDFRIALEELYFYNFATRNTATSSTAGLMSPADKIKLDSLDTLIADVRAQINGLSIPEAYTLPVASTSQLGGVKVGDGLDIDNGTLNVTLALPDAYTLPVASTSQLGGVKVGDGLGINDGFLRVTLTGGDSIAQAAIADLQTSIDNETSTRTAAVSALTISITDEASARVAGDSALTTSIDNEASARVAGDSALTASINNLQTSLGNYQTALTFGDGLVLNVDTVSVDHNIFAPLITSFALSAGDWTLDGNESTAYSYVANVAVSGLDATDYAVVDFNRGSQDLAVDAEICPSAETQAEVVKLFAQNIPSGELTGQVTVWKR